MRVLLLSVLVWCATAAPPLPFHLEVDSYWDPSLGPYAKIHLAIAYDELLFVRSGQGFTATYTASYRVVTPQGERVHTGHLRGSVQVFSFAETNQSNVFANEEVRLRLPPGTYEVRVSVQDMENQRVGTQQRTLVVRPPQEGGVQLSSLRLVGCDGDGQVLSDTLPEPCQVLRVKAELYAFGDSFPLVLPLRVVVRDSRGKERVTLPETLTVVAPITLVEIPVTLSRLEPGSYEVQVRASEAITSTQRFVVPWSVLGMVNVFDDALRLLSYVATREEVQAFRKLDPQERKAFWEDYWASRDPVPSTPRNELLELYRERIMYANEHFSSFEEGWKTDMGMVYVRFGPPDDIERHPFDRNQKPFEIWWYHALKRRFVFVDRTGFGKYDLVEGDLSPW